MKEEQKSPGGGKLPVPECYYLMGTADPTGILESDEVCVILYVYCLTFFFIFLYG
jgi:RNA-dependent RNA polymerase